jgi:CBS domain-containing protein
MSTRVSALLAHKESHVVSVSPDETVFAAIERMVEHNVGAVVVLGADRALAGIFTERDYLRRIALEGRTSRETRVESVMTSDLVTVPPGASVDECLRLMTDHKIRHLPVVEAGGTLVGIVSIGDCVREVAARSRAEADSLHRFVAGGYPA